MILARRLIGGIVDHFPTRVSEWITTAGILGLSGVLWAEPTTFDTSRSFTVMMWLAEERTWAAVCFCIALTRFAVLTINGTFKDVFPYSPHIRGWVSLAACVFWGELVLSFLLSAILFDGSWTGVVMYGMAMALDTWNMARAWADVGESRRAGAA